MTRKYTRKIKLSPAKTPQELWKEKYKANLKDANSQEEPKHRGRPRKTPLSSDEIAKEVKKRTRNNQIENDPKRVPLEKCDICGQKTLKFTIRTGHKSSFFRCQNPDCFILTEIYD